MSELEVRDQHFPAHFFSNRRCLTCEQSFTEETKKRPDVTGHTKADERAPYFGYTVMQVEH